MGMGTGTVALPHTDHDPSKPMGPGCSQADLLEEVCFDLYIYFSRLCHLVPGPELGHPQICKRTVSQTLPSGNSRLNMMGEGD